jgi:hypothetical protein
MKKPFRVVIWNLHHAKVGSLAWDYLLELMVSPLSFCDRVEVPSILSGEESLFFLQDHFRSRGHTGDKTTLRQKLQGLKKALLPLLLNEKEGISTGQMISYSGVQKV